MVELRVNVRQGLDRITAQFSAASSDAVPKATYRAINRAVDKAVTETSREVRKVYNLRDRAVKAAMKKRYASRGRLVGEVMIQGLRIALVEFDARWTRRMPGASVRIKVGAGRKTVAGAFIAASTANNYRGGGSMGMKQVYRRVGRERYPIRTLRSLSIPQAVGNQAVLAAIDRIVAQTFEKNFEQQMKFLLQL